MHLRLLEIVAELTVVRLKTPQHCCLKIRCSYDSLFRTPLSLEEIGRTNRKRHAETGGALNQSTEGGPLELEAIAAVHELSSEVRSISVSEILPRTADLIFVNIKSVEGMFNRKTKALVQVYVEHIPYNHLLYILGQPFTLELTMKGWRVASLQCDSMNGDYKQVGVKVSVSIANERVEVLIFATQFENFLFHIASCPLNAMHIFGTLSRKIGCWLLWCAF